MTKQSTDPAVFPPVFHWGIAMCLPVSLEFAGQAQFLDGRGVLFLGLDHNPFDEPLNYTTYIFSARGDSFTTGASSTPYASGTCPAFGTNSIGATTLGDGRILAIGLYNTGWYSATLDPVTLLWSDPMLTPLDLSSFSLTPRAVTLASGNAFVSVGALDGGTGCMEYNQTTNTWSFRAGCPQFMGYSTTATLLPSGDVFISSGDSYTSYSVAVYETAADAWHVINTPSWYTGGSAPQFGNGGGNQALLPDGRIFVAKAAFFGPPVIADIYDPVTHLFEPVPTQVLTNVRDRVQIDSQRNSCFYVGDGWVVLISTYNTPTVACYNIYTRTWRSGNEDEFDELGNLLPDFPRYSPNIFHLGASKFLLTSFETAYGVGRYPRLRGCYVQRSDLAILHTRVPTFAGVTRVISGNDSTKMVVQWAAATDAVTNSRDIEYYIYVSNFPGVHDFTQPTASTRDPRNEPDPYNISPPHYSEYNIPGVLSMEVAVKNPGITNYVVVRARNMTTENTQGNFETNTVEARFTSASSLVQDFNWRYADPLPEAGDVTRAMRMFDGRILVSSDWGQKDTVYANVGGKLDSFVRGSTAMAQFVALDAEPFAADTRDLLGTILDVNPRFPVVLGGINTLSNTSNVGSKLYFFQEQWNANYQLYDTGSGFPPMLEALCDHSAVTRGGQDIIVTGGKYTSGSNATATANTEVMTYADFTITVYDSDVSGGTFSYGDEISGTNGDPGHGLVAYTEPSPFVSGVTIIHFTSLLPIPPVYGWGIAGGVTNTTGVTAAVCSPSLPGTPLQSWAMGPALNIARSRHSSIALNNGSVLVCGGLDISGLAVIYFELYTLGLNVYGYTAFVWNIVTTSFDVGEHYDAPLVADAAGYVYAISGSVWSRQVDRYDPATNTVTRMADIPEPLMGHSALYLDGGYIVVIGGNSSGATVDHVWRYSIADDTWTAQPHLLDARAYHACKLLSDTTIFVAGGRNDSFGSHLSSTEITSQAQRLIFSDGFESGGWASAPVAGSDANWTVQPSGINPAAVPHSGIFMALFNSHTGASGHSGRIYTSGMYSIPTSIASATLTFWMYHDSGNSNADNVQVQISPDNVTWSNVGSTVARFNVTVGWAKVTVDVTSLRGQTLHFGFLGHSAHGNNMYLDDVSLTYM